MSHRIRAESLDKKPILLNLDAVEAVEPVGEHGAAVKVTLNSGVSVEVDKTFDDFQYVLKLKTHERQWSQQS